MARGPRARRDRGRASEPGATEPSAADRGASGLASSAPLAPSVLGVVPRLASTRASLASLVTARSALDEAAMGAEDTLEPEDVTLAWELARLVEPPRQADAFRMVSEVISAARRGSTRVRAYHEGPAAPPQLTLPLTGHEEGPLHRLIGPLEAATPLVRDGAWLALRRWAATERVIAVELLARRGREPTDDLDDLIRFLRDTPLVGPRGPMTLSAEQEQAVRVMLSERTIVLTGGPGTGKTSVVVSFLRALARRAALRGGHDEAAALLGEVLLAAPTGKAADRLGEAIRGVLDRSEEPLDRVVREALARPRTLHRLLGYRPGPSGAGSYRAHRENPLAARVVLVDEVSMIDTVLFAALLSAVPREATLVLLGDPDQLPSVAPGAVLRDLVAARPATLALPTLRVSHRMDPRDPAGAQLLEVARACLAGAPLSAIPFRRAASPTPGAALVGREGAHHLPADALEAILDAYAARHLLAPELAALGALTLDDPTRPPPALSAALAHLSRARVLGVTRRSARELDRLLAGRVARARGEARGPLSPGEPLMVVENDYDEDLWNGDTGVLFRDARGELFAAFGRGAAGAGEVRVRPFRSVAHLVERAYALTVHKAQGSEHDEVLFVMPREDTPLSSREIVYTAITRARRSALVVASDEVLERAIARPGARDTGLVAALEAHAGA